VAKELEMKGGGKRLSPFPSFNTKKIFWSEDDFFAYLGKEGYEKIGLREE